MYIADIASKLFEFNLAWHGFMIVSPPTVNFKCRCLSLDHDPLSYACSVAAGAVKT